MGILCDLHIHSCLSPCADDDMTPYNLVHMAQIAGLQVIALTDHNSTQNCASALKAAEDTDVLVIPGMELSTSEDIHVICLFPSLQCALAFDRYIYSFLPEVQNVSEIFGNQLIMDAKDGIKRQEKKLLINASSLSITGVLAEAAKWNGAVFPAHIDKPAYSLISILGDVPSDYGFSTAEISAMGDEDRLIANYSALNSMNIIKNSDAHRLSDIGTSPTYLNCEKNISSVLEFIKNKKP